MSAGSASHHRTSAVLCSCSAVTMCRPRSLTDPGGPVLDDGARAPLGRPVGPDDGLPSACVLKPEWIRIVDRSFLGPLITRGYRSGTGSRSERPCSTSSGSKRDVHLVGRRRSGSSVAACSCTSSTIPAACGQAKGRVRLSASGTSMAGQGVDLCRAASDDPCDGVRFGGTWNGQSSCVDG
jgi:hypothetical protein